MKKFANVCATLATLMVPGVALAATGAAPESGVAGIVTGVAGLVTACAGLVTAMRGIRLARRADARAKSAVKWADRLANAHEDGVVLVLSYPAARVSCRGLLEANGWRICHYPVTQAELDRGVFLPGPHTVADVCVADAIVVEGLSDTDMSKLATVREFRDNIRLGAGVVMFTAGSNTRYDLTAWGECDQGVTTPVTCEAAVRASLARRAATARRQGIRPGTLSQARASLLNAD